MQVLLHITSEKDGYRYHINLLVFMFSMMFLHQDTLIFSREKITFKS